MVSAAVDGAGAPGGFVAELGRHGIETHHPPRGYLAEIRFLRGLVRERKVDLVHSHGYRADVLARAVVLGRRLPLVSTVHGYTGGSPKNRLYERIQRRVLRTFDAAIAVSRPLAELLRRSGVPDFRVHLVPNAYRGLYPPAARAEARRRLGIPAKSVAIGWVGRLTPEKGADVALRALALLGRPQWLLIVVGDGPERDSLEILARSLGIAQQIRWAGSVPQAGALTAAFDLFLLSSRTEGTPMVALEAMTAGVPIVATAVGGVPDLLGEDCGILVPPGDPAALAGGLAAAHDDPAESARRAARAREKLGTDWSAGRWLERHEALYQRLVSEAAESA